MTALLDWFCEAGGHHYYHHVLKTVGKARLRVMRIHEGHGGGRRAALTQQQQQELSSSHQESLFTLKGLAFILLCSMLLIHGRRLTFAATPYQRPQWSIFVKKSFSFQFDFWLNTISKYRGCYVSDTIETTIRNHASHAAISFILLAKGHNNVS